MLGFKSFRAAAQVLAGIELMHMIRKVNFKVEGPKIPFPASCVEPKPMRLTGHVLRGNGSVLLMLWMLMLMNSFCLNGQCSEH